MTTKAAAILGSLLLGSSYVAAVHVSCLSVPQSKRRRDSSQVILRRICGVVAHSVLSVAATCHFGGLSVSKLGLWISVNESVQVWRDRLLLPVLGAGVLTLVLFAGQIAQAALNQEALFHVAPVTSLKFWRAIVVAPITEEVCFRVCMLPLWRSAGFSVTETVFAMPLVFGLAHLHHLHEHYITNGRTQKALKEAVLISSFQFAYTTVFGWFATFLLIRTGSAWSCIVAHCLCNSFGFPDLSVFFLDAKERRGVDGSY